ncbi:cytidine deaminase [Mycoplasmoides pirum]|uniref:cytidine deaminase n=1 Tax=Mycoplasmoides pirum TaxID=2122 RepID=UPI0004898E3E|nr:cytidine deaminase [Mycoplasmoides pirum]
MKEKDIYFQKLNELISNAYVPYSNFRVSCLLLTDGGWFAGVNIENSAYSPTICAERSAVSSMITSGFKQIFKVYILTDTIVKDIGTPCGVCRQVLSEFAKPETPIITYNLQGEKSFYTLEQLLPFAFNKDALK